jgi:hypothetical protein
MEARTYRILGLVMSIAVLVMASSGSGQIRWRTGTSEPSGRTHEQVVDFIADGALRSQNTHLVIQFDEPITPVLRADLSAAGVTLLGYLGDNAFFASVDPGQVDRTFLTGVESLVDAQEIQVQWKLHPVLARGEIPDWAIVPVPRTDVRGSEVTKSTRIAAYVLFHTDVTRSQALEAVQAFHVSVRHELRTVNGLVIELPFSQVQALATVDAVQYLEPALPRMDDLNNSNRTITQADVVQAAPYNLAGQGVSVLVYDGGTVRASHQDFGGRATVRDLSGQSYHATHVAGTIGGSGAASGGTYRGMAPGVTIESYGFDYDGSGIFLYTNPGDIEDNYDEAINVHGADISNNSIGTNTALNGFPCEIEGDYGVTAMVIDAIVRGGLGEPFRIVWANGNERGAERCGTTYHTTAPPACAKNHVTVGALNSNDDSVTTFTSWGPTDDDRLKPDLAAPGCQTTDDFGVTSTDSASDTAYATLCGTSMASPTVCGLSALLLEDYRNLFPGAPDFRNSTLRALLAHNAEDIEAPGPDYRSGYGSVRIQRTVDFMRTGDFFEATVDQDGVETVLVVIDPGAPELRVTLAWDDPPGTPNVIPSLINDLDLIVLAPSSAQYFPWTLGGLATPDAPAAQTQSDHVNNMEQVLVPSPTPGVWTVQVVGFNVPEGPQPFSLCLTPNYVGDCNTNGVNDLDDIAAGTSYDCDANYLPDECEPDCNHNHAADPCDITAGTSQDCTANGTPDECEPDCNHNGTADSCDIAAETGQDCTANGVPDECEPDCNRSGFADTCDIAAGSSQDCDANGVPDECDTHNCCDTLHGAGCDHADIEACVCVADAYCCAVEWDRPCTQEVEYLGCASCDEVHDCNHNRRPDTCDLFGDPPQHNCCAVGHGSGCNDPEIEACVCEIDSFCCEVEWDFICVYEVEGYGCGSCATDNDCNDDRVPDECDVSGGTSNDCNANFFPDECEGGCNNNGIPDECDVSGGTSHDCNTNGVPDECEGGCNNNGVPDECDVREGTSDDCNGNRVPDECEGGCNHNGIPDECEIAAIHDCCQVRETTGCSNPEIEECVCATDPFCCEDEWDRLCAVEVQGFGCGSCDMVSDCNANGTPDECEVVGGGPAHDCCETGHGPGCSDANIEACVCALATYCCEEDWDSLCVLLMTFLGCGSCEAGGNNDCNTNGVPDDCEISDGLARDCNSNSVPDECEVSAGPGVVVAPEVDGGQNHCADAEYACPGAAYLGSTVGMTSGDLTGCFDGSPDLWYRYTPGWNGTLTVSLCGSSYDTVVSVHSDCPGTAGNLLACNDDYCGLQSQASVSVAVGTVYFIRISGFFGDAGPYMMQLTGPACASGDCNVNGVPDDCDVAGGTSQDCNLNLDPDECELEDNDCNDNLIPDDCDEAALITVQPTDRMACPGDDVTFSVAARGATGYQWYQDGDVIPGATTDSLTIEAVTFDDEGSYTCSVIKGCIESESDPATLTLRSMPFQQGTVQDLTKCEGERATFVAEFGGDGPLSYHWEQDGEPIDGATSHSYTISVVTGADEGVYRCKATNPCGSIYSNEATLTVDSAPIIVNHPDSQCVESGGTAIFSVLVSGDGPFFFKWYKDDVRILQGQGLDTVTIDDVQPSDAGEYRATVQLVSAPQCTPETDIATLQVDDCPGCGYPVVGDLTGDEVVDLEDFSFFQACFGAGMAPVLGCECANLDDSNDDIDVADFALWEAEFAGP